jgi:hypothetical protein
MLGKTMLLAVGALAAVVLYRLLTGGGRLGDLLRSDGVRTEAERTQLLLTWMGGVALYASDALRLIGTRAHALPEVSPGLLALLTGSQLLYLGGKWVRSLDR